ncbi:putative Clp, repeat (R) domain, P-loop containing nucleoside triphosphate hydrolase [Helianthus annuus]|nr:putative Clp, repeat (R) domain, P-loop containing nucleoside triphosphate hydrolase [Helianthus annuus]
MDLKTQIFALMDKNKEMSKAETEAGEEGPTVTEADIQHIVSSWTGIPVEKVSTDESDRLLKMEETLHTRTIGQDEAVKATSRAIRRARVGLKNPNRPIANSSFRDPLVFVAVDIPFTPRAKRVLELSLEEARQLGHNYIGSEHLLLGLLREGEGVAACVLENWVQTQITFAHRELEIMRFDNERMKMENSQMLLELKREAMMSADLNQ